MKNMNELTTTEKTLIAILSLLVDIRERNMNDNKNGQQEKIEILLSNADFNAAEIAKMLNKNAPAVRKAIQRGRK